MAVTVSIVGTTEDSGTPAQTYTYTSIPVASGDTLLAVFIVVSRYVFGNMSAVWDSGGSNQTMTNIGRNHSTNVGVYLFAILNPTAGSKNLAFDWTPSGTNAVPSINAISFKGTTISSITAACVDDGGNNGTSTTPTTPTVTGSADGYYISGYAAEANFNSVSDNQLMLDNNVTHAAANYKVSAASVSMTATIASSVPWATTGAEIVAAASAAVVPYNPLPQQGPIMAQRRKSTGWTAPLFDPRRRVLRPSRGLWTPPRGIVIPSRKIIKAA